MKTKCNNCDKEFEAQRSTARFCSDLCRVQFNRNIASAAKNRKAEEKKGPAEKKIDPPPGLTGIDLAIWKAEQKEKS